MALTAGRYRFCLPLSAIPRMKQLQHAAGPHLASALRSSSSAVAAGTSRPAAAGALGSAAFRQALSGCCLATSRATKCSSVRLLQQRLSRRASAARLLRRRLMTEPREMIPLGSVKAAMRSRATHLALLDRTSLSLRSASIWKPAAAPFSLPAFKKLAAGLISGWARPQGQRGLR